MADGVLVDNNELTDYTVSTDEAASGQVQRVKLTYSADGSDTHVTADAQGLKVQGQLSIANSVVNVSQAGSFAVVQATSPWLASIGGSVNVNNFPATQNVSVAGSVSVGNIVNVSQAGSFSVLQGTSPWLASIGGSVNVSNQVNVSPAGSVNVLQGTNPWNVNNASWGGAATTLGQKASSLSVPVVLPSDQTANVNIASTSGSLTVIQGTSGATSWTTKLNSGTGRTPVTLFVDDVAGISAEALATLSITKGGASQTASTTYIVSAGKILRLCQFVVSTRATVASVQATRARVRQGNTATAASPVLINIQTSVVSALINSVGTNDADLAEGAIEIPASTSLAVSHVETAVASNTFSCCLIGYEYTP